MATLKDQWIADADLFIADDDDVNPWTENVVYTDKATSTAKAIRAIADLAIDAETGQIVDTAIQIEIRSDATVGIAAPVPGDTFTIRGDTFRVTDITTDPDGFHTISATR